MSIREQVVVQIGRRSAGRGRVAAGVVVVVLVAVTSMRLAGTTMPPTVAVDALRNVLLFVANVRGSLGFRVDEGLPDLPDASVVVQVVGSRLGLIQPAVQPRPTVTAAPPTATSPPNLPFSSGGLGLSRREWEAAHGAPSSQEGEVLVYAGGTIRAVFRDDRLRYLERSWGDRTIQIESARNESRALIPKDAQFVRAYVAAAAPNQPLVELYRSPSLRARMPSSAPIQGEDPADFEVFFRHVDLQVRALVVSVGANANDAREVDHRY